MWYLGYGNRFIGLASNSNLIAIQAVVAISFIIAYFDSSENKSRKLIIDIKTIFLLIYIIGLIVMLLLTAVRAGILSLFVIYFASIFLAKKE